MDAAHRRGDSAAARPTFSPAHRARRGWSGRVDRRRREERDPSAHRTLPAMPELPEVELYCRYFAKHSLHLRVAAVRVLDERILAVRTPLLKRAVVGHEFSEVRRHGKHLFANADGAWLHLHFGMSGDLFYYDDAAGQPRFARVVFEFENGARLAYDDMRLFGVVDVTSDPDTFIAEHRLGPDPLSSSFRC